MAALVLTLERLLSSRPSQGAVPREGPAVRAAAVPPAARCGLRPTPARRAKPRPTCPRALCGYTTCRLGVRGGPLCTLY